LMMDRTNFPGMKNSWTYGAMYLYHGFEKYHKKQNNE